MPMYKGKAAEAVPFEARFCTKENRVDITNWAKLSKGCEAVEGFYYMETGAFFFPERFLANFEEVQGSML